MVAAPGRGLPRPGVARPTAGTLGLARGKGVGIVGQNRGHYSDFWPLLPVYASSPAMAGSMCCSAGPTGLVSAVLVMEIESALATLQAVDLAVSLTDMARSLLAHPEDVVATNEGGWLPGACVLGRSIFDGWSIQAQGLRLAKPARARDWSVASGVEDFSNPPFFNRWTVNRCTFTGV